MPGEEVRSQKRASRLSCSLSLWEISFYTATWISGVFYSLYTLYLASMDQVKIYHYIVRTIDEDDKVGQNMKYAELIPIYNI